ncbi:MAG: hypothetical protein M3Q07_02435 [Pseudobdellovibrionaceae bacterium]|nr:hypothetical protein [Pseudobdellovibrionaceae bacterium]
MKVKTHYWSFFAALLITHGCQKSKSKVTGPTEQNIQLGLEGTEIADTELPTLPLSTDTLTCLQPLDPSCSDQIRVNQELSKIFSSYRQPDGTMTSCQDQDFGQLEQCRKTELQFRRAEARATSRKKRILIIDDGMELPALTRYQQQVLDILKISSNGDVVPEYDEGGTGLFIPALHAEALQQLGSQDKYITSKSLHLLAKDFRAYFRYSSNYTTTGPFSPFGHGSQILVKLADSIPDAQFVVLHHPRQGLDLPAELYCSMGSVNVEEWSKKVKAFYGQAIQSIQNEIIERYEINYINASFGHSYPKLKQSWESVCGNVAMPSDESINRYFDLLAVYYQKLGSFDQVLTVQAGLEATEGQAMLPPVCRLKAPQRLIADVAMREVDRPVSVEGDQPNGANVDRSLSLCGDVFLHADVASPYEMGEHAVDYDIFGFDRGYAYPATHSSYIAPIVLAHAVYLQSRQPQAIAELIAGLKAKPVRAPWRFAQIPACDLDERICQKDALFVERQDSL